MKVNIKTDPETLFLLHRLILNLTQTVTNQRSARSMRIELFEILAKRCISYSANPNGRPRTITLRYHLAQALLDAVTHTVVMRRYGTYEHNKLELFKNHLHQQLL